MKRFNLSFYNDINEEEDKLKDAILRVTFTSPQDMSGRLRTTRFKLSKGAFPLFFLGPDETVYSSEKKRQIDMHGLTPTGLVWGYIMGNTNTLPCSADTYLLSASREPIACVPQSGNIMPFHIVYRHVFLNETPKWKLGNQGWVLSNDKVPVFNWNFLTGDNVHFSVLPFTDLPEVFDSINSATSGVEFTLVYKDRSSSEITTPVHFMSDKLFSIIRNINDDSLIFSLNQTIIDNIGDPWLTRWKSFHVVDNTTHFSKQVEGIVGSNAIAPEIKDLSSKFYYTFERENGTLLFPYTAILIVIDELNFVGENIVVNDKDLSGVISPSVLSTFKTYLVSMDSPERSDFCVVDDTLTQAPLTVTAPHLATLTVRLFMLTKQNDLIPMKIPAGEGFFIQISVE